MSEATPGMIDHFSGIDGELFEMFEPADAQEAAEVTRLIVERTLKNGNPGHPVYLRQTRHNVPHLDHAAISDYTQKLQDGCYEVPLKGASGGESDLILVTSGATVLEGLKAAEHLAAEGTRVKLV